MSFHLIEPFLFVFLNLQSYWLKNNYLFSLDSVWILQYFNKYFQMHFQENLLSLFKEDFKKDYSRSHLFNPKENIPRGAHQGNFSSNQIQNQDKIQEDYEKIYKEKYQVSQISLNKQKQENSLLKKQNERLKLVQGELLNRFKQKFLQQLKGLILSIKQVDQMYQSLSQRQNSYKYEIDKIINSVKKTFSNQLDSEKKFSPNIDRVKTLEKEVNLFRMQTIQKQNIIQKLQENLKQKQEQLKKVKTELNQLKKPRIVNQFLVNQIPWQDCNQSSISINLRQDSNSYSRSQDSSTNFTLNDKKNESFQRKISAEQSVQLKSKMETIFRFLSPIFCQNLSKKQKIIKQERINKIFNTNPDQTTLDHNLKYIAFCQVKNAQNQIIIFFNYAYSELRLGFAIFKQGFLEIKYESSNFEQQWTAKYESESWKVKCIITSDESQCYSKQWICSQLVLLEL